MVSWQPVKRDSFLQTVQETNGEKIAAIYDALARERGKFSNFEFKKI
jgi:hypothetical protein